MGSLTGITQVLTPLLSGAGLPATVIGASANLAAQQQARAGLRRQQATALAQLQSRQGLEEDIAAQNAAGEKAKIAADAQNAEARRKAALRRAVARQKTLFSAQGLSSGGGSNEAVLLGLYNDSDADAAASARSDALRVTALDQSLNQQKQKNLLELAQLAQNQSLSRALAGY